MDVLKWAVYDLSVNPPAYDFLVFMQIAQQEGANAVWFIPGVQKGIQTVGGEHEELRRLREVAYPICDLYGFKRETGEWPGLPAVWPDPSRAKVEQDGRVVKHRAHSMYWIKQVKTPFPVRPSNAALDRANDRFKGNRPIVVTMREATDRPLRNSGPDWRRWALDHEAVVLEDWCVSGMSIDDRVACYDLASLNIGSSSGQMHLCYFSTHRPYLALRLINDFYPSDASPAWWKKNGWNLGDQMPWADKTQKLVWNQEDDYQTIEREFQEYMKANDG